jgi:hypothetical protein
MADGLTAVQTSVWLHAPVADAVPFLHGALLTSTHALINRSLTRLDPMTLSIFVDKCRVAVVAIVFFVLVAADSLGQPCTALLGGGGHWSQWRIYQRDSIPKSGDWPIPEQLR